MMHRVVKNNNKFSILETRSDQTVLKFPRNTPYAQARSIAEHFDAGGGFGGWTPPFFLKDPKVELEKVKNLTFGDESVA